MKKIILFISLVLTIALFTSCSNDSVNKDKVKDLEFTVVEDQDVPQVIKDTIQESKKDAMKFSFSDGQYLYIVVGYGEKPTSGYSIKVNELYEAKDCVVVKTELMGPSKDDIVTQALTYPYVVIKTEDVNLPVCYE